MLEKIILEEKEIQADTIERLLSLGKALTNVEPNLEKEESNGCLVDIAKLNLQKARLINDLVINLSDTIQGGN